MRHHHRGTWRVDNNHLIDSWPQEGDFVEVLEQKRTSSGSGSNLAIDIRHLDPTMPVETITLVGDDENGRFLRSLAEEAGINHRQMYVDTSAPTQFVDAYASARTGHHTRLFAKAVASFLTPDHFDLAATAGRILHLGLPSLHKLLDDLWTSGDTGWVTVLKKAQALGLKTNMELANLEPQILIETVRPCLDYLDYVVASVSEISVLAGLPTISGGTASTERCEAAARAVLSGGAMDLVVVHWSRMAIAVARDGTVARKASVAIPPDLVVGTNGADDAFTAGLIYGLHEGWPLEQSLTLAQGAAACSMRSTTTSGAVISWQETLKLADEWGWQI